MEERNNDNSVIEPEQFIDERVILNVGGIKYETYRSTLTAHPKTLLGTMFHPRNQVMLHPTNGNEYFIDRNGHIFHYIMEYYRTGNIVWRSSFELPYGNPASLKSSNSSTTTVSSTNSVSNNNNNVGGTHTDFNNVTVPNGAAAALSLTTTAMMNSNNNSNNNGNNSSGSNNNNNSNNNNSNNNSTQPSTSTNQNRVLHHHHHCSRSNSNSTPPIFPPYVTLPELEQEFSYFAIPFTSPLPIAQKAGGALLDEFTYSIEDLICTAIAKLIDRVTVTFFRDGSPLDCILIQPKARTNCSNNCFAYCCNRNCNNYGGNGAKLIEFSLNGYCIINHFYEDIKDYLEKVFPNMVFKLEFGSNYKSITMSMSGLFTRHSIQKYSKIGKSGKSGKSNDKDNED